MRIHIISGDGLEQSYGVADFKRELDSGRIPLSCLARVEGTAQWKPLKDLLDVLGTKSPAGLNTGPEKGGLGKRSRLRTSGAVAAVIVIVFTVCLVLNQMYLPPQEPSPYQAVKAPDLAQVANEPGLTKLQKSAENGNADDQFLLGLRYLEGDGVTKDQAEALKWFSKAAQASNLEAQAYLFAFGGQHGDGVFKEGVLPEPVPQNPEPQTRQAPALVIKGFYVGMPLGEVAGLMAEFNLTNRQELMLTNSDLPGYYGKPVRWLRATGYMRPGAIGRISVYFEHDKLVSLDMSRPTVDCLFNVFDLDQTRFAQQFVDRYGIAEMTPIVQNGYPAYSYRDELNGIEVVIYGAKSLYLRKIPKASERKFD